VNEGRKSDTCWDGEGFDVEGMVGFYILTGVKDSQGYTAGNGIYPQTVTFPYQHILKANKS
jgi:hypothetical protein